MSVAELKPEIWTRIVRFLQRPQPTLGTKSWKDLHQGDLATMMRVSKIHNRIAARLLYREPIIENVWSFLQCDDLDDEGYLHSVFKARPLDFRKMDPYYNEYKNYPKEYRPWDYSDSVDSESDGDDSSIAHVKESDLDIRYIDKEQCFKYTKKLHIILTDESHSINYTMMFLVEDRSARDRLWEYVSIVANPEEHHAMDRIGGEYATEIVALHVDEILIKMFSNLIRSRTLRSLRPKSLSFGAYGDTAWNERQLDLTVKYHSEIMIGSPSAARKAKQILDTLENRIGRAGCAQRILWSIFESKAHCTRFYGGPLGVVNQPFMAWQDPRDNHNSEFRPAKGPNMTFIHSDLSMRQWGITMGSYNVVIYHPINAGDLFKLTPETALMGLVRELQVLQEMAEIWLQRGGISPWRIKETTVDIYWGFLADLEKGKRKKLLKSANRQIKEAGGTFEGIVRLLDYINAPPCPSCGWWFDEDEMDLIV